MKKKKKKKFQLEREEQMEQKKRHCLKNYEKIRLIRVLDSCRGCQTKCWCLFSREKTERFRDGSKEDGEGKGFRTEQLPEWEWN